MQYDVLIDVAIEPQCNLYWRGKCAQDAGLCESIKGIGKRSFLDQGWGLCNTLNHYYQNFEKAEFHHIPVMALGARTRTCTLALLSDICVDAIEGYDAFSPYILGIDIALE